MTVKRLMPPWLPDPAFGHYEGERLLTAEQIKTLADWASAGAPKGNPADLPPPPIWREGWTFGVPDLVVQTSPFNLPPEGRDIYRNFVAPIPLSRTQYVAAVEIDPGNKKIAHHAFVFFDRSNTSRELDARDPAPGFDGMTVPPTAQSPEGYFLSWQPGKRVFRNSADLSWTLYPGSDLVMQIHMQPSGRAETIQSSVAFFFTNRPPTRFPLKLALSSCDIDIPAGKKSYVVTNSVRLPVDVDVLSVLPHTHYLGKELEGYIILPDGRTNWLIRIPDWNYNWQGDYRLKEPLFAPRGSTLVMHYTYDNSAENPNNPSHPPVRVTFGPQSRDEMAELWIQAEPRNAADYPLLRRAAEAKILESVLGLAAYRLRLYPSDAEAHISYAQVLLARGKLAEARAHLTAAASREPNNDQPRYFLGLIARKQNKAEVAIREFEQATRLNPRNAKAYGNLGLIFLELKNMAAAQTNFQQAIEINPSDAISYDGLGVVCFETGKFSEAETHFREAVACDPDEGEFKTHLHFAQAAQHK